MLKDWVKIGLILVGMFYVVSPVLSPDLFYKAIEVKDEIDSDQETSKESNESEKEESFKKEFFIEALNSYAFILSSQGVICHETPCFLNCLSGYKVEWLRPPEC